VILTRGTLVYIHTYIYTYIHTHTHLIYTYVRTYIYTYINTHTHTHIYIPKPLPYYDLCFPSIYSYTRILVDFRQSDFLAIDFHTVVAYPEVRHVRAYNMKLITLTWVRNANQGASGSHKFSDSPDVHMRL
jgi:hypothetical protein